MRKKTKAKKIADAGVASPAPVKTEKKSTKGFNPRAYNDLVTVSTNVNTAWLGNPLITLIWITQPQFAALVAAFTKMVTAQQSTASGRSTQTGSLKALDASINVAVEQVKINIASKFKKPNAKAQYARYGIIKQGKNYRMSPDRDDRVAALKLMISAIATDGFGADPDYGTAYWTGVQTSYEAGMLAASSTDESVSGGSGNIKSLVKQINKAMTALRFVLKGNYPDNTDDVYRSWGWLRRDY